MNVTLKYDPTKYKVQKPKKVVKSIEDYRSSLQTIRQYDLNDEEWLVNVRNISERLNFLRESYKVISSFRKRKNRMDPDVSHEMKLQDYLSEEDEATSTENTTPKRARRGATNTTA